MTAIVAVDIGGTHARFALAEVAGGRVTGMDAAVTLQTAAFTSLEAAWQAFGAGLSAPLPRAAAIAVAAPVAGESIRLTNNAWTLRPATLAAALGVDDFVLVNDFEAVGHAVAQAGADAFAHLCGPDVPLPATGTTSIIGPGTGLGVAQLWRDAGGYHVQPTEGGHGDFAPTDAIEDAILVRLRARHRRVSVERVVSGPGIVAIHETLASIEGLAVAPGDDRTLWTQGLAGADRLAAAAVDRFCMALGGVAGDIALVQGAGGVVIAGGLGLRLRDRLAVSEFAGRFAAKGRFAAMMAAIPVKLITHPQPGLFGAAAAFARKFEP